MKKFKNRVRLRWNRNTDSSTNYYKVYRSAREDVDRNDRYIMKVKHPAKPNWISVEHEVPERLSNIRYQLEHDTLRRDREVQVFVNNNPANHLLKSVDKLDGQIIFTEPPASDDVITVNYEFDGIEIIDDILEQDAMIEYLGPPAEDRNTPQTPDEINIVPLPEKNGVKVMWSESSTGGQPFYYRVEAGDGQGNFSALSNEIEVVLDGGLSQKGYVIERSIDNGRTWRIVSQIPYKEYYEFGIDTMKPSPAKIKTWSAKTLPNKGKGEVYIELFDYEDVTEPQASPLYRVYSRSSYGAISDPTDVVGPIYIKIPITKIVVIRQNRDTLSEFEVPEINGEHSILVAEFEDLSECKTWDYPDDNSSWRYAIYAIDNLGNHSIASMLDVKISNASPPVWDEDSVTVRPFPLIV